jgi:hypothetical protein
MQKKISVGSLIWSLTCFSLSFRGIALADDSEPAKVATIVILNNTGLPDDKIYVNLSNTAPTSETAQFCPGVDMTTLFQWYGGYGSSTGEGGLNATQITDGMVPHGDSRGNVYYPIKLSDMRGWVLSNASNATSSSLTPTVSDPWWAQQNYASLGVSNYPAGDAPTTGLFPTISLGLFGACETGKTQFAGRIAISAYKAFTGDTFLSNQSPVPPPYVLFEGSIFPTDAKTTRFSDGTTMNYTSGQASNFDISYVDQIGIAADMELWGPTTPTPGSEYVKLPLGKYATGGPLVTAPDTIALVNSLVETDSLQTIGYPVNATQTVYNYYSFKSDLSGGGGGYPNPFGPFLDQLVQDTWAQGQQAPPATHPVLRVGSWGKKTFVGGVNSNLAFNGDPFYGNATGYQLAGYLGYFAGGSASCSDPFWEQILQWLPHDMPAAARFVPGTTPQSPCFLDPGEYLLLVGGFPTSSETQDSINPKGTSASSGEYEVAMIHRSGPLSVQLVGFDPTAAQPASTVQACAYYNTGNASTTPCTLTVSTQPPATIQSVGVPPGQTSRFAFFDWNVADHPGTGAMESESGGIGLNFFNQLQPVMALGTVKLAAGLTANVTDGKLRITLKSIANITDAGTDLARVTLTIPSGTSYQGGEADAVAANSKPALGWTDWPLTVDWVSQTCTMAKATLPSTNVTWEYYNGSSWTSGAPQNGAPNTGFIAACAISQSTAGTPAIGYQVFLEGDNVSVATTSDNPLPHPLNGSSIVAGLYNNEPQIYYGGRSGNCQYLSGNTNDYLACSISLAPAKSTASESLHLLAIPMSSLKSPTGIAGNNPSYRFFRFNANTPAWEESVCEQQICAPGTGQQYQPWPSGQSNFTPNGPSNNNSTPLACAIVNDLSGRIAGDAVAAFSYGMVSSTMTGNDFPNASWPTAANYPPRSTAIGDLTTGQYFTLGAAQSINDGNLPIGSNLWPSLTAYDPYVDIGINKAMSNEYFSGFGDRLSGGFMTPGFDWAMDKVPSGKNFATLGYEPGSPSGTQTVIVIRLHSLSTSTPPSNNCPWDLDQNGVVGAGDVSVLLLDFGRPCPSTSNPSCSGDFDGNNEVDAGDISFMLVHWGPCPSGFMDGLQADRPTPMIGEELDAAPVRMGPLTRSR